MTPMQSITPNCRDKRHRQCVGGLTCDCACHHVPPPPNLRQLAGLDRDTEEDR